MSLSPDVTPFVPSRQQPAKPSAQSHSSHSTLWEPSVDVAEFVPSWLNNKPKSSTEYIETSNVSEARRVSAKVEEKNGKDEKCVEKQERKINSTKKGPKQKANPTALKTNNVTSSSGKDDNSKLESDKHETANLSWNTDFPALGAKNGHYKTPIWNKPLGVSFSDKLKTGNTSSYSYNEPSSGFNDKTKGQQKASIRSKDDEDECKKIDNMNKEEVDSTPSEYGFSVVKSKSKKKYEAMEHRHKNIPLAWDKVDTYEKTNSEMKGVKKSSNNRSKTSVERGKDYKQDDNDPKSRLSEEWATGKDIANDKREAMRDSHKGNRRTKQSFKPAEDYYNFKSTHRGLNLEEKHYEESDHEERRTSRPPVNISTAMTTPSLSYSDILKSKSNTKVPIEGSKNEKGFLRIPSEKSENEGVDEKEVEEQGKRKKKKKKKKKSGIETQPQTVKKSKEALTLDFGDMLEKIMESSASKKKPIIRTGGFLPAQAPLPPKETRTSRRPQMQAANVLDSTAPIVFRSKEREFPKKKKPSAMRKILTKEREDKKMLREGKSSTEIQTSDDEKSDKQSSDEQGLDEEDIDPAEVKKTIHSRKFREYCDHDLDYDINGVVIKLLKELIRFQDRLYQKDPIKAKARRRFVCGLREVHKHARLKKLKCVIVTPNLEPTKSKGGLDDLLARIIHECHSQNVPVIFALNRQVLGKILLKKVPVSVVGIFYYDGAQDYFKTLMTLTEVARETYRDKFNTAREKFLKVITDQKQLETDEIHDSQDNNARENEAIFKGDYGSDKSAMTKDFAIINENIETQRGDNGHTISMGNDSNQEGTFQTDTYVDNVDLTMNELGQH